MKWILLALVLLAACQSPQTPDLAPQRLAGTLRVVFPDVGEGGAVLILTPDNRTIEYDCGQSPSKIFAALNAFNVTHLDLLITSHPHADHVSACRDILKKIPVDRVVDNNDPHPTATNDNYRQLRGNAGSYEAITGDKIDDEFPFLQYLVAFDSWGGLSGNVADDSIVIKFVDGNASFLINGDCEEACEKTLTDTANLRATVLNVGHHGSKYSSTDYSLQEIRPSIAVISVGAKNPYGFPTPEALGRLKKYTDTILRTDERGTIVVETDGDTLNVSDENGLIQWMNTRRP
jgi:competence protein ComEC